MFRLRRSEPRYLRCAVAALTLVSFVIAAIPMPLSVVPLASSHVGGDEPFPCQGGRCGCRSAKQCWTACCCRKPSERKKWAEEHQLVPPAYAILHDAAESARTESSTATSPRSCCAAGGASDQSVARAAEKNCCATAKATPQTTAPDEQQAADYVLMIRAMECRGLGYDLSTIVWFQWTPVVPVVYERDFERLSHRLVDDRADSLVIDPATPPPRIG